MQDADCEGGSCTGGEVNAAASDWPMTYGWAGNGGSMPQLFADPSFVDPPRDLALRSGSPAIGAGDPAQRAALDQRRRAWKAPDIGALGFGDAAPSAVPPGGASPKPAARR